MFITDALLGEHAVFHLLIQHIEQTLPAFDSLPSIQHHIAAFAFALETHAGLEDELLFIALEPHLGTRNRPLALMRMEHNQITDLLGRIKSAASLVQGSAFALQMIQVTRGHFQKEEHVLFRMARQVLGEDELFILGAKWEQRRVPLIRLDMP